MKPKPKGYPADPKTIGEHIRRRRMDLGLFQRELAERVGAEETSVNNWERGRADPELKFMPAIFAFLGCDPRPEPRRVGERLVRYREQRAWSQKRLAEALHVDPTTLSRWELGKAAPWGEYAVRVAAQLGEERQ